MTFRQGSHDIGKFRQGWVTSEGGTGSNARNCAFAFWDADAINTVLNGMIIDSVNFIAQGTTGYGLSNNISFYLYKSPYQYSDTNGSNLSPNDYYPNGTFVNTDGTMMDGYIQTAAMGRNSSSNFTTALTVDFLQAVRDGYGLMAYRRTQESTPTTNHYTRETTNPIILEVTYHAPVSSFSLSASTIEAGQTITANINRTDSSYTHTITFTFGSASQQYTNVATSQGFTIPLSWMNQIPNSASGTATCTVKTYNGATLLGEAPAQTFTITVPASVKPTLSSLTAALVDGYWGLYVQGYSKAQLTANGATGAYGSSITGYSIAGKTTNPATTEILYTAGTNTFHATVTDSRGRTSEAVSCAITVTAYAIPSITGVLVQRASDASGTLADEGTYCKCTLNYNWSAIGSNARTTAVDYREVGTSTWISGSTALITSGGYVVLGSGITFAVDKSYDLRFSVDDSISGAVYAYTTLYTAKYIMDFKAGGNGVCFGGVATIDNAVEIAQDWKLQAKRAVFTSTNDAVVGTSGEATGVALITGDVAGSHIEMDNNEIMAKSGNTPATLFLNNEGGAVSIGTGGLQIGGVSIFSLIYPVGCIYMSVSSTNPSTLFGGTWVSWGSGRVPVGVDAAQAEFNTVEETGGTKTHTLTNAEVPAVTGSIGMHAGATATTIQSVSGAFSSGLTPTKYFNQGSGTSGASSVGIINFNNGGGGGAHNNLQPYITCYMWKRTA